MRLWSSPYLTFSIIKNTTEFYDSDYFLLYLGIITMIPILYIGALLEPNQMKPFFCYKYPDCQIQKSMIANGLNEKFNTLTISIYKY